MSCKHLVIDGNVPPLAVCNPDLPALRSTILARA